MLACAVALVGACDSDDDDDTGGGTGTAGDEADDDAPGSDDAPGDETAAPGDDGGGLALGSLSATGAVDGESFTIECVMRTMSKYSMNSQYDWLCQSADTMQTFTGPIAQINIQGTAWGPGMQTADASFGGAISVAQLPSYKNLATSLAESGGLTVTLDTADDTSFSGTASGSWVQEGITIELDASFNLDVAVM